MSIERVANTTKRIINISKTLLLEQLKEPTALLWTTLSPSALYIFLLVSRNTEIQSSPAYIASASWFYAYISSSTAFFGLSFYLIGRRESGFTRSFIYHTQSIRLFLTSHLLSYLTISLIHFSVFYLITRPFFGSYTLDEYTYLIKCFYVSYCFFSSIGLLISTLPIRFSTASTLFSILSFTMLSLGYLGAASTNTPLIKYAALNPLNLSTKVFLGEIPFTHSLIITTGLLIGSLYITVRQFRIQPVWSRY